MPYLSELHDFFDPSQDRPIPVKLYLSSEEGVGWVLLSVGFGGTRESYGYLARAWTDLGLHVAVVEHVGSNLEVLKGLSHHSRAQRNAEVVRLVSCPHERLARPKDFLYVYSQLKSRFGNLPLALAGHSYGTYTVLSAMGLQSRGLETNFQGSEVPVRCTVLMSPQPPGMLFAREEYRKVGVPTLVVSGTKDDLLDGSQDYLSRREVYEVLPTQMANLLIFEGVAHMTFAGLGLNIRKQLETISFHTSRWLAHKLLGTSLADSSDSTDDLVAECLCLS